MQKHLPVSQQNPGISRLEIVELEKRQQQPALLKEAHLRQRRSRTQKQWRDLGWAMLYLAPALILFAVFSYYPFFRAVWLSMNVTDDIGNPVRFVGFHYYLSIFNLDGSGDSTYIQSLFTSCRFAVMVVLLEIVFGIGLALLTQANIRGVGVFRVIFTLSIAVSLASAGVFWSLLYDPSTALMTWVSNVFHLAEPGVLNNASTALPAMAIMTVWSGLGFNFVIALAGLQAIPLELYESSSLDGAGYWNRFRYITLPLLTPILLFLLIVNTIQSFQAFTQFNVLMAGPGPDNSTNVLIYQTFQSFWIDHRDGFASAMSIVLFVILLILSSLQIGFLGRKVNYQ